jgi:hypothetical protein
MNENRNRVEALAEKVGLVVEKTEIVDPEDGNVLYSVIFILDKESEHDYHLRLQTDDYEFFQRFVINQEYRMTFLKWEKDQPKLVAN